jgi:hypothetical protein
VKQRVWAVVCRQITIQIAPLAECGGPTSCPARRKMNIFAGMASENFVRERDQATIGTYRGALAQLTLH